MSSDGSKAATIFVNSEVRTSSLAGVTPNQVTLTLAHCPFLSHESIADCSGLREWNTHEITEAISRNNENHVGYIQSTQIQIIKETIFRAKTIPLASKREFQLV